MTVDAAFSSLPGIDRTLVALGGGGIHLTIDGRSVELAEFESTSFAGESAAGGGPRREATRDLNLMVRRGTTSAEVRVHTTPATHELSVGNTHVVLVVIGSGRGVLTVGTAEPTMLGVGDGVFVHGGDRVSLEASGVVIVVTGKDLRRISPAPAASLAEGEHSEVDPTAAAAGSESRAPHRT